MDPSETPLHRFRSACLDWLELDDPSQAPVPSLDGLSPSEVVQARRWLERLREARAAWERVESWRDRRG